MLFIIHVGPKDAGPKSVRQLRDLYWTKKNDVFGSTPVLLKDSEVTSKELESTLKEWLGEDVVMTMSCDESDVDAPSSTDPKPKPRYAFRTETAHH